MPQTIDRTDGNRAIRSDYPEDRFDRVARSGRVGAHRIAARPRYVWQYLIAALLGFALLTTLGIVAVQAIGDAGKLPSSISNGPQASAAPQVTAELDPTATVAVLNGTGTENLAAAVDQIITQEGWGSILFSGAAASADVQISAVFYTDPADAPAAEGLAAQLGGLSTYTTSDYQEYGARLVVLLGSDYAGPGIDEARAMTEEEAANSGADASSAGGAGSGNEINPDTGNEINPETGNDIDEATGWDIDAATGWPIDPTTGLPTDPTTIPVP
ncbi:LytR C-terminal domain-containing protein [Leucobacter allii]|uniref:LytR C-terminal domain-containing protein n=1 Tax=Leucobacter allii TaxID=2932247 RepID=UPI001FD4C78B|nr:LytR C-terminal domain-containing protein [Leucobacter allii]UOR00859.1 LytR C-terminal domain-containing protein [Leucobacter allii]